MPDLLLEIGCEEIPARMIDGAREELGRRVAGLLDREGLAVAAAQNGGPAGIEAFSTPRRLAVLAHGIAGAQADVEEQVTGPAVKAAFKEGQPTVAAQKFAEKVGLPLDRLERVATPKGEYLAARTVRKGRPAAEILSETLPKEIAGLYWGKSMYWRPGRTSERFVRPVRWLVAILDGSAIPLSLFGIEAGDQSRGHRTLGRTVSFRKPGDYSESLRQAAVLANPQAREQTIRKALDAATRTIPGARWREDAPLMNKVVNLTEWPSAIAGGFDAEFLSLPEEVLVTVMRDHQNYFAIQDASGRLAPHFLAVLNTGVDAEGIIRHGHERVLRARFNDARFFWNTDQKVSLPARVEMLKPVTFQKDLGSYYEKAQRVAKLAESLANELKSAGEDVDVDAVRQAAWLAKTDLTTELVKEFTELQGVIGGLYASHQGLGQKIANAIYDQYKPESMEDEVPRTLEGAVLSIADKADSIAGMFALGLIPSSSKDPFALRRQANGIVKIVAEKKLPIKLQPLLKSASETFPAYEELQKSTVEAHLFMRERIEFYLRDIMGFQYDTVRAVLTSSAEPDNVVETVKRAEAVESERKSDDFVQVAIAFRRIRNILRQAKETGWTGSIGFVSSEATEDAERRLADAMKRIAPRTEAMRAYGAYADALREISKLRPDVDLFFDSVMVMTPDKQMRENRLALLSELLKQFSTIADFSEIVAEKK